jgi:hypothetical protein
MEEERLTFWRNENDRYMGIYCEYLPSAQQKLS